MSSPVDRAHGPSREGGPREGGQLEARETFAGEEEERLVEFDQVEVRETFAGEEEERLVEFDQVEVRESEGRAKGRGLRTTGYHPDRRPQAALV